MRSGIFFGGTPETIPRSFGFYPRNQYTNALKLGRRLGAYLPEKVMVVGIESLDVVDFNDKLSEDLAAAIPIAAQTVLDLIHQFNSREG
jgi:Ni,Fe-hydrogenase maturation factor